MASVTLAPAARIRLRSGLAISYVDHGPRHGRVVLLLHGWSDSSFSFTPVFPLLGAGLRAVALDHRGHGDSDRPLDGYAMRQLARDAIDFLDAVGIDRVTVVGHSMGGFVAQHLAAMAPDRVVRLILVGTAYDPRVDSVAALREMVDGISDPVDPSIIRSFQADTIATGVPEAFFEAVVAESRKLPARVWKAAYSGFMDHEPPDVSRVTCPVELLWGTRDQLFSREDQERTRAAFRNASLTEAEGIGHALHWEAPEALARVLA